MPNIKDLAQTVLTWEGKVFAAADADAAETNWKHKVTPDQGDLNENVVWLIIRVHWDFKMVVIVETVFEVHIHERK